MSQFLLVLLCMPAVFQALGVDIVMGQQQISCHSNADCPSGALCYANLPCTTGYCQCTKPNYKPNTDTNTCVPGWLLLVVEQHYRLLFCL